MEKEVREILERIRAAVAAKLEAARKLIAGDKETPVDPPVTGDGQ